jgi:hypothetical protein
VITLEQHSSAIPHPNLLEKGGAMKKKNNADTPKSKSDWKKVSLAMLKGLFVTLSLLVNLMNTDNAAEVLP